MWTNSLVPGNGEIRVFPSSCDHLFRTQFLNVPNGSSDGALRGGCGLTGAGGADALGEAGVEAVTRGRCGARGAERAAERGAGANDPRGDASPSLREPVARRPGARATPAATSAKLTTARAVRIR